MSVPERPKPDSMKTPPRSEWVLYYVFFAIAGSAVLAALVILIVVIAIGTSWAH